MSLFTTDATLGKLIFTDRAIAKMKEHRISQHHIITALKRGKSVKSDLPHTRQIQYRPPGQAEFAVMLKTENENGTALRAVIIMSCWKTR